MEDRDCPSVGRLLLYMVLAAGLAGGLNGWIFASGATRWAAGLDAPNWAPPGAVIGTVWIFLFQLKAIALWIVERLGKSGKRWPAALFIIAQFAMSVLWVCMYFGQESVANGFVYTVLALALSVFTLWAAARAHRAAAVLLWPLFAWLVFATALSFRVLVMNTPASIGVGF